ncbi:DUF1206 domain-containing protein [Pontibacter diazotrophicus]|uniref:DUF1206 domain-containing protein n=1 Tax=Pontibacter diazotrophicus TaxID=1400979 RepID=A0A3D8L9L0_9BACT|nr:DUF1206 domain-containing protein [Pontibacter diazotrophicus]RDV13662.1 DUF1206 domain-containing protein [Pontibacter diazotrophicus]
MKFPDPAEYIPSVPHKWVKHVAQVGLTAKGIVYCLLGILALVTALELGRDTREISRKEVFLFIEELFLGRALLLIVAVGLACYCVWRLLQALTDTEGKGADIKGLIYRARYGASGAFYGILTFVAAKLAVSSGSDSEGIRQSFIAEVLQKPLGQWLVLFGAALIGLGGVYFIYEGISERYRKKIKEAGLGHKAEETMIKTGKIGYVSRGTVWGIFSYLLLRATLNAKSGGAESAFHFLESAAHGAYLLGAVALGLICYSLFVFIEARFRYSSR